MSLRMPWYVRKSSERDCVDSTVWIYAAASKPSVSSSDSATSEVLMGYSLLASSAWVLGEGAGFSDIAWEGAVALSL